MTQHNNLTAFWVGAMAVTGVIQILWSNTDRTVAPDNSIGLQLDNLQTPPNVIFKRAVTYAIGRLPSQPGTTFRQPTAILSGGQGSGRLDGVAGSTDGNTLTGATTNDGMYLFGDGFNGGTAHALNYRLCEFVIYDRTLSAGEIEKVEKYLKNKWATP